MIRRGFWLAVGATGGIMGYRRATALGRQLSATLSPPAPRDGIAARDGAAPRDGADRRAEQPSVGRTAARTSAVLTGKAGRGLVRGTIRFTRDARMFSRDVREGMDLYLVRHRAQGSPTLGPHTANDERVKDDR